MKQLYDPHHPMDQMQLFYYILDHCFLPECLSVLDVLFFSNSTAKVVSNRAWLT
jgi:hypothetical protein